MSTQTPAQPLTPQQIENVRAAISLARNPGFCKYAGADGEPSCVIAQLAILEGYTLSELSAWDATPANSVNTLRQEYNLLPSYPIGLLQSLQTAWDGREGIDRTACYNVLASYLSSTRPGP